MLQSEHLTKQKRRLSFGFLEIAYFVLLGFIVLVHVYPREPDVYYRHEPVAFWSTRIFNIDLIDLFLFALLIVYFYRRLFLGAFNNRFIILYKSQFNLYWNGIIFIILYGCILGIYNGADFRTMLGDVKLFAYTFIAYFLTTGIIRKETFLNLVFWAISIMLVLEVFRDILYLCIKFLQTGSYSIYLSASPVMFPFMEFSFICLMFLLHVSIIRKSMLMIPVCGCIILYLYLQAKAMWLAQIITFLLLFYFIPVSIRKKIKAFILFLGISVLVLLLFSHIYRIPLNDFKSRFLDSFYTQIDGQGHSLSLPIRILQFKNIWYTLGQNNAYLHGMGFGIEWTEVFPILDLIPDNLKDAYTPHRATSHLKTHFFLSTILYKVGFLGLVIYIWAFWGIIRKGVQVFKKITNGYYKALTLGLLCSAFYQLPFLSVFGPVALLFGITVGLIDGMGQLKKQKIIE